jgi:hypothetical protein
LRLDAAGARVDEHANDPNFARKARTAQFKSPKRSSRSAGDRQPFATTLTIPSPSVAIEKEFAT